MGKSPKVDEAVAEQTEESAPAKKTSNNKRNNAGNKPKGRVLIDEERCKGCGLCVAFCPKHVLEMSERFNTKGYHPPEAKSPGKCSGCDLCGYICPDFAIYSVKIGQKKNNKGKKKP